LGFPKKFLKASTVVWISAGVTPEASNTCGSAWAAARFNMIVKPRVAIASKSGCLARGADVRFEVSNRGALPRPLVEELFIDCIGFCCLRFVFCFGFSGVFVFAGSCA